MQSTLFPSMHNSIAVCKRVNMKGKKMLSNRFHKKWRKKTTIVPWSCLNCHILHHKVFNFIHEKIDMIRTKGEKSFSELLVGLVSVICVVSLAYYLIILHYHFIINFLTSNKTLGVLFVLWSAAHDSTTMFWLNQYGINILFVLRWLSWILCYQNRRDEVNV